jgi:hypothetical protein
VKHVCYNCQNEFEGNFCPVCGQKSSVGRVVDWPDVLNELKGLGAHADAPLPTIGNLLWRPGHLISEYTGGRRKVCTPPISLLLLVAVVVSLILSLAKVGLGGDAYPEAGEFKVLAGAVTWLMNNLGWAMLIMTVFLIFPTWILFRFSPRHTRHTWPEGIFIQLFMSTLVLIFSAMGAGISPWLYWLIPVYYYIAYRQFFGYGVWGTLWRTALVLLDSLLIVVLLLWLVMAIFGHSGTESYPVGMQIATVSILVAVIAGTLGLGWWIGRKRYSL